MPGADGVPGSASRVAGGTDSIQVTLGVSGQTATVALDLPVDATVSDAVDAAELAREHIRLLSVNGIIVAADTVLQHRDVVYVVAGDPDPTTLELPPELVPHSLVGRFIEGAFRYGRKGFARIAEFTPSRLNLSWIDDHLAAGGAFRTSDIPRLQHLGIRGVVDCREEDSDDEAELRLHGIGFLRLPTPDVHKLSQDALDAGVDWVNERIDRGEKVFVHCYHGVGRGPLLGCCVLVSRGMSAGDALKTMKTRRWQASPNEEQLGALLEYATRHRADRTDR